MNERLFDILKPRSECIPEQLLIRYAEGKLSPEETRKVEEHLSECELCSDALDGILESGTTQQFRSSVDSVKRIIHKKVAPAERSATFPMTRMLAVAATLL